MEGEERREDKLHQRAEIPEQRMALKVGLQVNPEEERLREVAEKSEAEKLREEVEMAFARKETKSEEPFDSPKKDYEKTTVIKKDVSIFERMGVGFGKLLGPVADLIRRRVDNFDINYSGGENIRELEGRPYIFVANHIKPKNILMQAAGLSPDSFVLEKIGRTEGEKIPKIITNVNGKIGKIPVIGLIDKVWSSFREGVMEGTGFIPVKTRKGGRQGGFNRNFVENVREAVKNGEPIIIFPQGGWSRKFNPELSYETGAATIARNYDLPIVPAYIEGADSWSNGQKVSVNIGRSIIPGGKTKEEITAEIRDAIRYLSEEPNE